MPSTTLSLDGSGVMGLSLRNLPLAWRVGAKLPEAYFLLEEIILPRSLK